MIPRVSEIEDEPVIGKFYMVPCVWADGDWQPVIGPRHEDKEHIGFDELHFHKDPRFISDREVMQGFDWAVSRTSRVITCSPAQWELASVLVKIEHGPRERRRKCHRRMPTFPADITSAGRPAWQLKLERAYEGATLACMRCPHRGIPLDGLPVKDGKVICPGHGLAWDVSTGELVPR
jgi:hypothetical protein